MNVLVTGSEGFIGKELVRQLVLRHGPERVWTVDIRDRVTTARDNGQHRRADLAKTVPFLAIEPEYLIHLAGPVAGTVDVNPASAVMNQLKATMNVLEQVRTVSPRTRIVLASSFYVYDGHAPLDIVNEYTPLLMADMNLFGSVKLLCEKLCQTYEQKYGIEWVGARFGSAYGRGSGSNVVTDFVDVAETQSTLVVWGNGDRRNQYTSINDLATGMIAITDNWDEVKNTPLNLVSPEETTTSELAEMVAAMYEVPVDYLRDKPEARSFPYMHSGRALHKLGWLPTPLQAELKELKRPI